MKPLRYTPGLKCDAALEAMRPERLMKHQAIQGGDQWKKKLIQTPQTYEGSFADADMQQFRPHPTPNPMNDQWFVSRLPDQPMGYVDMGGYPSDQLSQIKMRNRRFQQSCAMEGMQGGFAPPTCTHDERASVRTPTNDDAATDDRGHDDDGRHAGRAGHDRPGSQYD